MSPSPAVAASHGSRLVILAAVCLAALVLPLSFTGAAVATPEIGRALGGSAAAQSWIVNAFMLSFGSCLMAAGMLADEFGRKRVFGIGIGLFSLVSFALGFVSDLLLLDLLRAVQGVAAAAALAGGSAALAQEFEGPARVRAFSMLGTTFGVGLAIGPVVSGWLVQHVGWRSIFATGTVIGTLSLVFGVPRMRESRDPEARGVDWPGTASFTAALVALTFALMEAPDRGWSEGLVRGLLAAAGVALAVFVVVENVVERPMLDLSLFRYRQFIGVQSLPIATAYCYVVLLVILPMRLIGIEGRSPTDAGLLMMALSGPMLVIPMGAAHLARRISNSVLCGGGLVAATLGLLWLGQVAPGSAPRDFVGPLLVIGVGTGFPWGLMDGLSVSVVPKERAGMATGIFSTTRVAGEGIALAIVGGLLVALLQSKFALSHGAGDDAGIALAAHRIVVGDMAAARALLKLPEATLLAGYDAAFRALCHVLAALTAASAGVVFAFLRQPRGGPAAGGAGAQRQRPAQGALTGPSRGRNRSKPQVGDEAIREAQLASAAEAVADR